MIVNQRYKILTVDGKIINCDERDFGDRYEYIEAKILDIENNEEFYLTAESFNQLIKDMLIIF